MITINSEAAGPASDCLVDLLETLGIDLRTVSWRANEFAEVAVPEWTVVRQDDNGVRAKIEAFSGYRKARAFVTQLETGAHKQTYWIESNSVAG